jgi:DNA modification methylase
MDCTSGIVLPLGALNQNKLDKSSLDLAYPNLTIPSHNVKLKPKDLIGIPWMVAFALRADGWYLRQDCIWSKANPMPESVTDRCTKSHEYIFLLTKSARYYYDAAAIKEPCVYAEPFEERCERAKDNHKAMPTSMKNGIRPRKKTPQTFGGAKARNNEILEGDPRFRNGSEQWGRVYETTGTRNKRSVWSVTTQPYREAHFATFPEEIPRTCILAGSKKGDTILDPFSGAGTTGVVAEKLNRKYIGIELNPQYTKMAEDRIYNVQPLFAGLEL